MKLTIESTANESTVLIQHPLVRSACLVEQFEAICFWCDFKSVAIVKNFRQVKSSQSKTCLIEQSRRVEHWNGFEIHFLARPGSCPYLSDLREWHWKVLSEGYLWCHSTQEHRLQKFREENSLCGDTCTYPTELRRLWALQEALPEPGERYGHWWLSDSTVYRSNDA